MCPRVTIFALGAGQIHVNVCNLTEDVRERVCTRYQWNIRWFHFWRPRKLSQFCIRAKGGVQLLICFVSCTTWPVTEKSSELPVIASVKAHQYQRNESSLWPVYLVRIPNYTKFNSFITILLIYMCIITVKRVRVCVCIVDEAAFHNCGPCIINEVCLDYNRPQRTIGSDGFKQSLFNSAATHCKEFFKWDTFWQKV